MGTPGGPVGSHREPVNRRTPPRSVSSVEAPPTRSTATVPYAAAVRRARRGRGRPGLAAAGGGGADRARVRIRRTRHRRGTRCTTTNGTRAMPATTCSVSSDHRMNGRSTHTSEPPATHANPAASDVTAASVTSEATASRPQRAPRTARGTDRTSFMTTATASKPASRSCARNSQPCAGSPATRLTAPVAARPTISAASSRSSEAADTRPSCAPEGDQSGITLISTLPCDTPLWTRSSASRVWSSG